MHALYERCKKEIDLILCKELTKEAVYVIGQLVDICKDIKNIEYWKHEIKEDKEYKSCNKSYKDSDSMEQKAQKDIDSMIEELKYISERMRNSGSDEDRYMFKSEAKELIESAKKIKAAMSSIPLDDEMMMHYRNIFK